MPGAGEERAAVVQAAPWGLIAISGLLTPRALGAGTWPTMWAAALVSLAASLLAIWSIGSPLFLLTCLQLGAAIAIRRAADWRGWTACLVVGIGAFGAIVYGLALARAWDAWPIAMPLAFAATSLLVFADVPLRRGADSRRS